MDMWNKIVSAVIDPKDVYEMTLVVAFIIAMVVLGMLAIVGALFMIATYGFVAVSPFVFIWLLFSVYKVLTKQ